MRKWHITVIIIILVTAGCRPTSVPPNDLRCVDSIFTAYIKNISITHPEQALALLDTAEHYGLLFPVNLNRLRSVVYNKRLGQPNIALAYSLRVHNDPAIREDTVKLLRSLKTMSHQYYKIGNYAECIRYALEGIEVSCKAGSKRHEALFLLYIGLSKASEGVSEDAYSFFDRSIALYQQEVAGSRTWRETDRLLYAQMKKINALRDDKKYGEAVDMLPLCKETLCSLRTCPDLPEGVYDLRSAHMYTLYAMIFYLNGNEMRAEKFYHKLLQTHYIHRSGGNALTVPYQIISHRYREALLSIKKEKEYFIAERDTVNAYYVETLLYNEKKAYEGLDDYRSAARIANSIVALTDSLRSREKRQSAMELTTTIYETKEKETLLKEQATQLKLRGIVLAGVLFFLVLAILFIWEMFCFNSTIRKKNEAAVSTKTDPAISGKDNRVIEDTGNEGPFCSSDHDRRLFERVEHEILNGQLFLIPGFSRNDLTKNIHIPKNKFAYLFKQYAGKNFTQYMNDLRLEHAARILKEYPGYTIDAVATQCGMSSQSFYRLFPKKFGVTPMEFQTAVSQTTHIPCLDDGGNCKEGDFLRDPV